MYVFMSPEGRQAGSLRSQLPPRAEVAGCKLTLQGEPQSPVSKRKVLLLQHSDPAVLTELILLRFAGR